MRSSIQPFWRISMRFWAVLGWIIACTEPLAAQTGSVVVIDADKVLVINGRKVFPITMSPGPPTAGRTPLGDDALEELADGGTLMIRMAQTSDWNDSVIA